MIIDSHCHAWRYWPYEPAVPDPESRGTIDQLIFEMDQNGVERAFLVCAGIEHNPDNNRYIASASKRFPGRILQVADIDCSWSKTYHLPGAAERLLALVEQTPMVAFTHYLRGDDDGSWLNSDEGNRFFDAAMEKRLIASIACRPHQIEAIAKVAQRLPDLPILLHHLGGARVERRASIDAVCAGAKEPNIGIKLSGFYYATMQPPWSFPYDDTIQEVVRPLYNAYGAERLYWGSDYPVCRKSITYPQALAMFRDRCAFIPEHEHPAILGENLAQLLARSGR